MYCVPWQGNLPLLLGFHKVGGWGIVGWLCQPTIPQNLFIARPWAGSHKVGFAQLSDFVKAVPFLSYSTFPFFFQQQFTWTLARIQRHEIGHQPVEARAFIQHREVA